MVQPIVRDSYSRAALTLGIDRDHLSVLLQSSTAAIQGMNLKQYQAVLSQSIKPFIFAKTALVNSPLSELTSSKDLNLSAFLSDSVFDVIDAILNVPIQNISFIFNWTARQQAKLKIYTLGDMLYYREIGLQSLGSERLFTLVEYILQQSLPTRTTPTRTLPACKRGLIRESDDTECIDEDECTSGRCSDDSLCQNYFGGFDCECKVPGYFKVNINENCKACKTYSATIVITNMVYRSYLKDKLTDEYFDTKEQFEATVNEGFRKSSIKQLYYGCRVQEFRRGSVIVDFLIFTRADFSGSMHDLQNALTERVDNSTLGPYAVSIWRIRVEDFDECKAGQDKCDQHETCVNKEGSFECKDQRNNIFLVVTIVLSCVVVLSFIVIGLLIWRQRRPSRNTVSSLETYTSDEGGRVDTTRDKHVSEPGSYMELHPRTSDGQPIALPEYQSLQYTTKTSGYYNTGFNRGNRAQDEYDDVQMYAEIDNAP